MNLLPLELIQNGIDAYLGNFSTASRKIYLAVIVFVIIAIGALPFVFVDISVRDAGIIRPVAEKTEIKSGITEQVDSVYVREGQKLNKGDTILTFLPANPDFQIEYRQKRLTDLQEHINDLKFLAKGLKPASFCSASRQQEYALFLQHKLEQETNLSKAQKDYERHRILFINNNKRNFYEYK